MANIIFCLTLLFVALSVASAQQTNRKREQFKVLYEWNTLDFAWPSDDAKREAIAAGNYVKENVIVTGIKQYGDRLYLSLPRYRSGVPATLVTVPITAVANGTSPLMTPYPNWAMNEIGKCNNFQSIQNFEIDRNGVMWIIDTGRSPTMESSANSTCPPTLTLMNLADPTKAVRYSFPDSVANNKSSLSDIVVDDTANFYAYITDSGVEPGIIVFSLGENRSWKLRDANSMRAALNADMFKINGITAKMSINVNGIALGPRFPRPDGIIDRRVFYSPMASYKMYAVLASSLQNEPVSTQPAATIAMHITELGVKSSQTDGMMMDDMGFLYYGAVGNNSIIQWDSRTNFVTSQHIIARDMNYIQWPGRFAFDDLGHLYVVVNRFHNFVGGKVNPDEVNYRILKAYIGAKSYFSGPTFEDIDKEIKKAKTHGTASAGATGATAHVVRSAAAGAGPAAALLALALAALLH